MKSFPFSLISSSWDKPEENDIAKFKEIWDDFWVLRRRIYKLDPRPCGNPMCCPESQFYKENFGI